MSQQTPMSLSKLVRRSLAHYRGTNLAVLAGVALTSAILSGALVVGDSVRESLRRNAEARLSQVGPVLIGGERFFSEALGERLGEQLGEAEVAPLLLVEGTASARKTGQRLNRVQLIGVTDAFWKLSISGEVPPGSNESDWIGVNETLAKRLDSTVGDTLITRFELPSALSRDAPLSGESEQTLPFTAKIAKVLGPEEHGLFSLRAEQIPPATIYLPLSRLQEVVEQPDRVNLLLASRGVSAADFSAVVESSWDLSDLRLYLKPVEDAGAEGKQILSDRVFFSPAVAEGIFEAIPDSSPVLTYLAVTIRSGDRETPYSMVTGVSPNLNQIVSADLPDDGVILSDWIADDLEAAVGDPIEMEFFVVGRGRELEYQNAEFTVASVAPLDEAGWGKSWTPEFPGIFDVEDLDDWEPGIPIDRSRIRDKDDEYWDDHRATPKAFISLARARQLWGNRFGENTAIRVPASVTEMSLREGLREQISLSDVGIVTRDLAAEAEAAVANSYDFGTLFASMSFFLIIAALTLTGLLLVFGIEQRASQIGLLLALGWSRRKVRLVFIAEALLVSVIGAFLGLLGGYLYTRLALAGMSGVWSDAAAGIEFVYRRAVKRAAGQSTHEKFRRIHNAMKRQ
ncbi:MAG: ABC transporter permease, partial [Verrucomicrobiota bacterium]